MKKMVLALVAAAALWAVPSTSRACGFGANFVSQFNPGVTVVQNGIPFNAFSQVAVFNTPTVFTNQVAFRGVSKVKVKTRGVRAPRKIKQKVKF